MPKVTETPSQTTYKKNLVIKRIEIYKNDVRVIREEKNSGKSNAVRRFYHLPEGDVFLSFSERQEITRLTSKSRKNLAFIASNTDANFDVLITLTYPSEFPLDGKESKRHLQNFIKWLKRNRVDTYLWFLEFQKRGAPHYHILIDSNGLVLDRIKLSETWYKQVGSKDKKHLLAGTKIEYVRKKRGLNHYAVKYATKTYQKNVPKEFRNVGRFWGTSWNVTPRKVKSVGVDCEESLSVLLKRWKHAGEEKNGYTTLFGASEAVLELLKDYGL